MCSIPHSPAAGPGLFPPNLQLLISLFFPWQLRGADGCSAVPASLEMLCSLLSLCLERGEGRECWSFILSRGESHFPTKARVTEFACFHSLGEGGCPHCQQSLLFSLSPLTRLGSFISLLPRLCGPVVPFCFPKAQGRSLSAQGGLGWCFLQIGREGAARELGACPC